MVTVHDIQNLMLEKAPSWLAEDWDNIGIHCGREDQPVTKVMVALDASEPVMREAVSCGCDLLLVHHPRIFGGIRQVNDGSATGRALLYAASHDLACVCHHTNLDCTVGGIGDLLAEKLNMKNVTVVDSKGVVDGKPCGFLRIGEVEPCSLREFAAFVKKSLGCSCVRVSDGGKPVHRLLVGGGDCTSFFDRATATDCDTFLTGDIGYHRFCDARDMGINLVDAGHFATEVIVCGTVAGWVQERFPNLVVLVSETQSDPIEYL